MEERISDLTTRCLTLFRALEDPPDGDEPSSLDPRVFIRMMDEQSRFKVWSGNIGAHTTGTRSLDHRLRDASEIRSQVISLLKDLIQLLEDAAAIARGDKTPWDQQPEDPEEAGAAGTDSDDDDGLPATELNQIVDGVADVVNCLVRLTVTIRNPGPHGRYIKTSSADTSHFEAHDIAHVRSKFNNVEPWLAHRLGKAISRRRQYFKYRGSHHEKLSYGLDGEFDAGKALDMDTIASSVANHLKDGFSRANHTPTQAPPSDNGVSQTSYVTSAAGSGTLTIPPLPDAAASGPFQCCFCYARIAARDRMEWK